MSRTLIVVIAVGLTVFASVVIWVALPEGPASRSEPASAIAPSGTLATQGDDEADRAAHRERFFEGDPNREVLGGQEMRPRW